MRHKNDYSVNPSPQMPTLIRLSISKEQKGRADLGWIWSQNEYYAASCRTLLQYYRSTSSYAF